ncbi:MAG: hypothetical protein ACI4QB_01780, partial [Eubacteriales bacterium]
PARGTPAPRALPRRSTGRCAKKHDPPPPAQKESFPPFAPGFLPCRIFPFCVYFLTFLRRALFSKPFFSGKRLPFPKFDGIVQKGRTAFRETERSVS